ncbi:MAG TPA: hypothetical protein V6C85_25520 [Allocoleopsis sp.]
MIFPEGRSHCSSYRIKCDRAIRKLLFKFFGWSRAIAKVSKPAPDTSFWF